jgi:hypothetical protein
VIKVEANVRAIVICAAKVSISVRIRGGRESIPLLAEGTIIKNERYGKEAMK